MKEKVNQRYIPHDAVLIEALKKMDSLDKKLLIVLEGESFYGLVSAGDIQRAIISNKPLTTSVKDILRKNIKVASEKDSFSDIKEMMIKYRMELCPVLDQDNRISKVLFWEDIFTTEKPEPLEKFNLPVVIMAGGFGTRMQPLTHVIPKPLIPLDDKTMLEHIFERFNVYGCDKFHISVNYKADLIEYYLRELKLPFSTELFKETEPLGTAGSLSLLKGKINSTFFVTNCDILVEQDYSEILKYHREQKNDITLIAALKNYAIPYGTIETSEGGKLLGISEKPDLTFKINSGMYILEPGMIDEIPPNTFYHITNLIENIRMNGGKVGVFPVSENSWKDVGVWEEYLKVAKINA
jgi:dTDP-glucose pyrophosphorylase